MITAPTKKNYACGFGSRATLLLFLMLQIALALIFVADVMLLEPPERLEYEQDLDMQAFFDGNSPTFNAAQRRDFRIIARIVSYGTALLVPFSILALAFHGIGLALNKLLNFSVLRSVKVLHWLVCVVLLWLCIAHYFIEPSLG